MKPPPSLKGMHAHRKRLGRGVTPPHEPPMDRVAKRMLDASHFVGMPHEEAHEHLTGAGYDHHPVFEDHHHYHKPGHSVHLRVESGEVNDAMGHDCPGCGGGY